MSEKRALVRRAAAAAAALSAAAVAACHVATRGSHAPVDPAASAWAATLTDARAALADGRPARADTVLAAFHDRFASSPQAVETLYWRAVARVDLAAPNVPLRPVVADLDAYRAAPGAEHRAEAGALRRALALLDSARTAAAAVPPPDRTASARANAGMVPRDSLRALDDELQRARVEAAAARAELDRIRRRLAAPVRRP